jgi:hypothetical protein
VIDQIRLDRGFQCLERFEHAATDPLHRLQAGCPKCGQFTAVERVASSKPDPKYTGVTQVALSVTDLMHSLGLPDMFMPPARATIASRTGSEPGRRNTRHSVPPYPFQHETEIVADLNQFDRYLSPDGPVALVIRENLMPVEGTDGRGCPRRTTWRSFHGITAVAELKRSD